MWKKLNNNIIIEQNANFAISKIICGAKKQVLNWSEGIRFEIRKKEFEVANYKSFLQKNQFIPAHQ